VERRTDPAGSGDVCGRGSNSKGLYSLRQIPRHLGDSANVIHDLLDTQSIGGSSGRCGERALQEDEGGDDDGGEEHCERRKIVVER